MYSIGYICYYNTTTGNGLLMDAGKHIHVFNNIDEGTKLSIFDFVTYRGKDMLVVDVKSLNDYSKLFANNSYGSSMFDNKEFFNLKSTDSFWFHFLVNKNKVSTNNTESSIFLDTEKVIESIIKRVDYVTSHKQEIADSYTVTNEVTHVSKIGGDDRFYTNRSVTLLYRDIYLDTFFANNELLDYSSGYSSNYDSPYKEGRDISKEKKDRENFILNYSKVKHITALLVHELPCIINLPFLHYWFISNGFNNPLCKSPVHKSIEFLKNKQQVINNYNDIDIQLQSYITEFNTK